MQKQYSSHTLDMPPEILEFLIGKIVLFPQIICNKFKQIIYIKNVD